MTIDEALELDKERRAKWNSMLYRTVGELQDDYSSLVDRGMSHGCVGWNTKCEVCEIIYESEL